MYPQSKFGQFRRYPQFPRRRWQPSPAAYTRSRNVTYGTTSTAPSTSRIVELEQRLNTLALSVLSQRLSTSKKSTTTSSPPQSPGQQEILDHYLSQLTSPKVTDSPSASGIPSSSLPSISNSSSKLTPLSSQLPLQAPLSSSELSSLPTATLITLLQRCQMSSQVQDPKLQQ